MSMLYYAFICIYGEKKYVENEIKLKFNFQKNRIGKKHESEQKKYANKTTSNKKAKFSSQMIMKTMRNIHETYRGLRKLMIS